MNNSSGWVKLYRSIFDWEWWDDTNTTKVFIYCLLKANPSDKQWRGISVRRGSFVTSRKHIADEVNLTEQEVRTAIDHLLTTGEITKSSTNKLTMITVTNYDSYQEVKETKQPAEQPQNQPEYQPTNNHNEEYKNIRSKEEEKRDTIVSPKKGKFDFLAGLISLDVEEQVAKDWMKVRAAKKASDSSTAFKQLETALNKILQTYGISHNDAIRVCVTNGWYGCKESYFANIRLSDYNITPAGQASLFDANTNQKTQWE